MQEGGHRKETSMQEMVVQHIHLNDYGLVSSDIDLEKLKNIINNNDKKTFYFRNIIIPCCRESSGHLWQVV
jgi:hypothetical protein